MITIYESTESKDKDVVEEALQTDVIPKVHSPEKGLSPYIENFLSAYEKSLELEKSQDEGQKIKVSAVLGKLARLYERIRTTVEYKGEHVLRRNAIERILKRLVWEQGTLREDVDTKRVADSLIRELIWAHYLPNNEIPESKSLELINTLEKYLYFLKSIDNLPEGITQSKVRAWMWGVASSEIEDILDPSHRELYVRLMYEWFKDFFDWKDPQISEHDKQIQVYLAIHRAYMKSDESIMRYHLLLKEFPDWQNADRNQVHKLIVAFPKLYEEIEGHLNFPGRLTLYRLVQKNSAAGNGT